MSVEVPQSEGAVTFPGRTLEEHRADTRSRMVRLTSGGVVAALVARWLGSGPVLPVGLVGMGLVFWGLVEIVWWRREGESRVSVDGEALTVEWFGDEPVRIPLEHIRAVYRSSVPGTRSLVVEYFREEGWRSQAGQRIAGSSLDGASALERLRRELRERLKRAGTVETLARSDERERIAAAFRSGLPIATVGTCLVLIAAFLAAPSVESGLGDELREVIRRIDAGALVPALVFDGDWFRAVTYQLVHADSSHLLFNLLTIVVCGAVVEQLGGRWRYLLVVLVAGMGAGVLGLLKPGYHVVAGSSALGYGLGGALLGYLFRMRGRMPSGVFWWAGVLGFQMAGYALCGAALQGAGVDLGTVDHLTHLQAVVLGAGIGLVTAPPGYALAGRAQSGRAVKWAVCGLLVVWGAGVGHSLWYRADGPHPEDRGRFAEAASGWVAANAKGDEEAEMMRSLLVDQYARSVARSTRASADEIERVYGRAEEIVEQHPETPRFRQTLARLEARRQLAPGSGGSGLERAVDLQAEALFEATEQGRPANELQFYASQLAQIVERCGASCEPRSDELREVDALAVLVAGVAPNGTSAIAWSCLEQPEEPTAVLRPAELSGLDVVRERRLLAAEPRVNCGGVEPRWRVWYRDTRLPPLE